MRTISLKLFATFIVYLVQRCAASEVPGRALANPFRVTNVSWDNVKIVGGIEAAVNEFPFLVSMQKARKDGGTYANFCAGSIYNENYVITAGHCVNATNLLTSYLVRIVAGEHDLATSSSSEQIRTIKSIHIHPEFRLQGLHNDIAILELESPLTFNDKVTPIPVATTKPALNSRVTVAGWGKEKFFTKKAPTIARKATIRVFPNGYCSVLNGITKVTSTMMCAGLYFPIFGGQDACQGDSGGPLFTETEPRQLVGIVSWGIGCAFLFYPGVYTRVAPFNEFIASIAGSASSPQ